MNLAVVWPILLAFTPPLHGRGQVPNAEAIRHNIAFYEERCEQTCKNKPELVRVAAVECDALPEKMIRSWNHWDAEGGANCSYRYSIPDASGKRRWVRVQETFVLRRWGCGGEGQEADLWCFTWNVHRVY